MGVADRVSRFVHDLNALAKGDMSNILMRLMSSSLVSGRLQLLCVRQERTLIRCRGVAFLSLNPLNIVHSEPIKATFVAPK